MRFRDSLQNVLALLTDRRALRGFLAWPCFSVTSYQMVTRLSKQRVLPRTVLDVGANIGQFAVAAAKLFPRVHVHSFEPVPTAVARLRRNTTNLHNVTTHPFAIGERDGDIVLHINTQSRSSSALPMAQAHREAFPNARESGALVVPVRKLDTVVADIPLEPPVLLKLDTQGYEVNCLRGAKETLGRVDFVVLEVSFRPMYEGEWLFMELVHFMEGNAFRFDRPVGWLSSPQTGEILQMDALFLRSS